MRIRQTFSWLAAAVILMGLAPATFAQEEEPAPGSRGSRGQRGERGGMRGEMPGGPDGIQGETPGGPPGGMRGETPGGPGGPEGAMAAIEKTIADADADGNGSLNELEYLALQKKMFAAADTNEDGALDNREFMGILLRLAGREAPQGEQPPIPPPVAQEDAGTRGGGVRDFMSRMDANGDGKITKDEAPERMLEMFDELDADGDGALDQDEMSAIGQRMRGGGRGGARGGGGGAAE